MALKNKVQVVIEGKIFTLMGSESEEYMKKIASYIDGKMKDIRNSESSKSLSASMVSVLTSINVADDYFKELGKNIVLSEENQELKLNMFDVGKNNVQNSSELESLESKNKELMEDISKIIVEKQELEKKLDELKQINKVLEEEKVNAEKELDEYITEFDLNLIESTPKVSKHNNENKNNRK